MKRTDLVWLLLAAALYGNTLGHGYALDDSVVIVDNEFTQKGLAGIWPLLSQETFVGYLGSQQALVEGGRYRPLSLVTFAIEQSHFGGNAHARHLINVLLYALTGGILFRLLRRLFPTSSHWWADVAWLGTIVFLVHPLHTEVVANLKGRDEILALLLGLTALGLYVDAAGGRRRAAVLCGITFFLALLAKESAIPLLVIFPLAAWTFLKPPRRWWQPWIPCLVAAVVYAAIRFGVTAGATGAPAPEILNDPFLHASVAQRLATVSHALGRYLGLLAAPHPLTHDYYYAHLKLVSWSDPVAIGGAVAHLMLLIWTVRGLRARRPWAFAAAFYLVTLAVVCNLLVSVGVILAERFTYLPSVGFALAMALLARHVLLGRARRATIAVFGAWIVALATGTIARNPAWQDSLTLFRTDIRTSPDSAKLQAALGSELLTRARDHHDRGERVRSLREALDHLQRAVEIYPGFGLGWVNLGAAQLEAGDTARALASFEEAIRVRPDLDDAYVNVAIVWKQAGDLDESARAYRRLLAREPENLQAWYGLGFTFEAASQPDSAKAAYRRMLEIDAGQPAALARLGSLVGQVDGDLAAAGRLLRAALDAGNREVEVYNNLGIVLISAGSIDEAIALLKRGLGDHPDSPELHRTLAAALSRAGDESAARRHRQAAEQLRSHP